MAAVTLVEHTDQTTIVKPDFAQNVEYIVRANDSSSGLFGYVCKLDNSMNKQLKERDGTWVTVTEWPWEVEGSLQKFVIDVAKVQ